MAVKLIRHNAGKINLPDDPTLPFKLEVVLTAPEFMRVAFVMLHGGSEVAVIRATTLAELEGVIKDYAFRTHPRLGTMVVTGPEGVIETVNRRKS